jgi:GNAT superfamily N-acetyltransferase
MKFERGIEPPEIDSALRVRRVDDGDDFGRIVVSAYGMPPDTASVFANLARTEGWYCFVAYDGDDAAGAAALYVHEDVGWLGVAGTAPEHRRKGAQNALLAARIAAGREHGVRTLTTETGERRPDRLSNSYRNILRAGFEERYVRPNLLAPVT